MKRIEDTVGMGMMVQFWFALHGKLWYILRLLSNINIILPYSCLNIMVIMKVFKLEAYFIYKNLQKVNVLWESDESPKSLF